jgi:hypothetical protein
MLLRRARAHAHTHTHTHTHTHAWNHRVKEMAWAGQTHAPCQYCKAYSVPKFHTHLSITVWFLTRGLLIVKHPVDETERNKNISLYHENFVSAASLYISTLLNLFDIQHDDRGPPSGILDSCIWCQQYDSDNIAILKRIGLSVCSIVFLPNGVS